MTKEETFQIEEYKSLREEITTKLKDRLEFNRWGLLGLAALYSYIFSNLEKPWLFLVLPGLSLSMIMHFLEEHRMVAKAGTYIRNEIEPWIAGTSKRAPIGWETYLENTKGQIEQLRWVWSPVPLWVALTIFTSLLAALVLIAQTFAWDPK